MPQGMVEIPPILRWKIKRPSRLWKLIKQWARQKLHPTPTIANSGHLIVAFSVVRQNPIAQCKGHFCRIYQGAPQYLSLQNLDKQRLNTFVQILHRAAAAMDTLAAAQDDLHENIICS